MITKNQFKLLVVFYISTLTLSLAPSVMLAGLSCMNPVFMLFSFGVSFFSAGTLITLLYKEASKQHEYYFYYNMGLSKKSLFLACIIGNLIIGGIFISIYLYAQHT